MTLTSGTQFGRYEIRSQLGIGGMGEVYRARDNRLNRDVAIKVLIDSCLRDPERMARFERDGNYSFAQTVLLMRSILQLVLNRVLAMREFYSQIDLTIHRLATTPATMRFLMVDS